MKYLLPLLLLGCALQLNQTSFAQNISLRAGLNFANLEFENNNNFAGQSDEFKRGINLGFMVNFPIYKAVSFDYGLLLSSKGIRSEQADYKGKIELLYLELPFTPKFTLKINQKNRIFVSAGPYLGVGISGKTTIDFRYRNYLDDQRSVLWGSDKGDDYKRIEVGAQASFGFEHKAFQISVSHGRSLASISTYTHNGYKEYNKVTTVAIARRFGNQKP